MRPGLGTRAPGRDEHHEPKKDIISCRNTLVRQILLFFIKFHRDYRFDLIHRDTLRFHSPVAALKLGRDLKKKKAARYEANRNSAKPVTEKTLRRAPSLLLIHRDRESRPGSVSDCWSC